MHKTVCIQVLDEMLLYRPPPPFEVHASIKFAYLDQTYLMRGKSAKPSRVHGSVHYTLTMTTWVTLTSAADRSVRMPPPLRVRLGYLYTAGTACSVSWRVTHTHGLRDFDLCVGTRHTIMITFESRLLTDDSL